MEQDLVRDLNPDLDWDLEMNLLSVVKNLGDTGLVFDVTKSLCIRRKTDACLHLYIFYLNC